MIKIRNLLGRLFPKINIQLIYYKNFGKSANLRNPNDIYEKLIWLNFNDRDVRKTLLADKYLVRKYLMELGLTKYLNELYGVYDSPEAIDFDKLPSSYILKCNHGANFNIICENLPVSKRNDVIKQLKEWMKQDYSLGYSELHYKNIKRKIICEKYLGHDVLDYKVECINGSPENIMICTNPSQGPVKYYCYSTDWVYQDILDTHHPDPHYPKPALLDELLDLCQKLSKNMPYVRVDTYIDAGKILFGEMTFTPSGFIDTETLPSAKIRLGRLLKIPSQ